MYKDKNEMKQLLDYVSKFFPPKIFPPKNFFILFFFSDHFEYLYVFFLRLRISQDENMSHAIANFGSIAEMTMIAIALQCYIKTDPKAGLQLVNSALR